MVSLEEPTPPSQIAQHSQIQRRLDAAPIASSSVGNSSLSSTSQESTTHPMDSTEGGSVVRTSVSQQQQGGGPQPASTQGITSAVPSPSLTPSISSVSSIQSHSQSHPSSPQIPQASPSPSIPTPGHFSHPSLPHLPAKYDGSVISIPDRLSHGVETPSTRVKNERETIRSILVAFCDRHNMHKEKERVLAMRTSWELIKESVKWFPGNEGQLPDDFIKAVSFPVIQGAGKQAGKGYRLLKHKLTGAKKSAADALQQRIRRDIDNWLRNQQGYQGDGKRKVQDPLAKIGLEAAKDNKSLRDIKANWVRLAHHYNIDYSEQLGGPSSYRMHHPGGVKSEPDFHNDMYSENKTPYSMNGSSMDNTYDELYHLLSQALKIIQRAREEKHDISGLGHHISNAMSNFPHAKRPRLEPGVMSRTNSGAVPVGMEVDPPTVMYGGPQGRRYPIKMHHSTKHEETDPNTVECTPNWDKTAPKRRFYSKDFQGTPFEKDFSKLRSMDFVCQNRFSFGLDRASVSPDKRILEFTIPIPPEATKSCRMASADDTRQLLRCDVQLTSSKEDEPPIFVKSFTYKYPNSYYQDDPRRRGQFPRYMQNSANIFADTQMASETIPHHNIGELPQMRGFHSFPTALGGGFQSSGGEFSLPTVNGNTAPPVEDGRVTKKQKISENTSENTHSQPPPPPSGGPESRGSREGGMSDPANVLGSQMAAGSQLPMRAGF